MRLVLNLIPIRFKADYIQVALVKSVRDALLKETFVPINRQEFPKDLSLKFSKSERLYCDFTDSSDADVKTSIELKNAPMFSLHYARHLIRTRFEKNRKLIVSKTMIGDNIRGDINILYPTQDGVKDKYTIYHGTTIKVQHGRVTDGVELVIIDDGITRVSNKNFGQLANVEDLIIKVIYKGRIYFRRDKSAPFHKDPENAFPILNKELEVALGIQPLKPLKENKYKRYQAFIENIANWAFFNGRFDDVFEYPLGKQLYHVPDAEVLHLDSTASDIYINNRIVKEPVSYKFYGPYKSITKKIGVIYIYQEGSGKADKEKVAKILEEGVSYISSGKDRIIPSMYKAIKRGISSHVSIPFKDLSSAIRDVSQQLANIQYEPDTVYVAIYVSPIGKSNWGHKHYNTVYAQLKELCLKHCVVLQGFA